MSANRNYLNTLRSKNGTFTPNRNQAGNYTPPQFDFSAFDPPVLRFDPQKGLMTQGLLTGNNPQQVGSIVDASPIVEGISNAIVSPFSNFLNDNKVNILVGFVGIILILIALAEIVKPL